MATMSSTSSMPCSDRVVSSACSAENEIAVPSNLSLLPSSSLSLSLAVTTATLAPAAWKASKIVGARRNSGSFIITSSPVSRSKK
jgi:hypothetical protein